MSRRANELTTQEFWSAMSITAARYEEVLGGLGSKKKGATIGTGGRKNRRQQTPLGARGSTCSKEHYFPKRSQGAEGATELHVSLPIKSAERKEHELGEAG